MSDKNKIWCNLNNFPCTHSQPDDLENCIYCENYSFRKYMEYKNNNLTQKGNKHGKDRSEN